MVVLIKACDALLPMFSMMETRPLRATCSLLREKVAEYPWDEQENRSCSPCECVAKVLSARAYDANESWESAGRPT